MAAASASLGMYPYDLPVVNEKAIAESQKRFCDGNVLQPEAQKQKNPLSSPMRRYAR